MGDISADSIYNMRSYNFKRGGITLFCDTRPQFPDPQEFPENSTVFPSYSACAYWFERWLTYHNDYIVAIVIDVGDEENNIVS